MFLSFDLRARQLLTGNILLIFCCAFYLAWWLIAFHPAHAVKGFRSGWLLLPALVCGLFSVIQIIRGCQSEGGDASLYSAAAVLIGAVLLYVILLLVSSLALKRQVTTELFLMVGWLALLFLELNRFYGLGLFPRGETILFLVLGVLFFAVGLLCYLLYYNLNEVKGYVDGMIPLLMVAVMMAVVTISAVAQHPTV